MKKCVLLFVFLSFVDGMAQLSIPSGATMETTVRAEVPVSTVKIMRLVCDLSNAIPTYAVSVALTGIEGSKSIKTIRINSEQAAEMMAAISTNQTEKLATAPDALFVKAAGK